jgi:putative transposase
MILLNGYDGCEEAKEEDLMETYKSLSHSRYDCKYHIVFVPKGRKKSLYGKIREYLKGIFHELARQKGCEIIKGYLMQDHVHMRITIPPKLAVSEVIGYLKGKSAIAIARQFGGKQRNFNGENFWARGYAVSTVGFELQKVKEYIAHQERSEQAQEAGRF